MILVAFLAALFKLAADLYVLAQSTYGAGQVDAKLQSYIESYAEVAASFEKTWPMTSAALTFIGALLKITFDFLISVGSNFSFKFTEVDGGVECNGVLSLMYFPIFLIIVAIVIVLFDSSTYVFLKVSPADYRKVTPIPYP